MTGVDVRAGGFIDYSRSPIQPTYGEGQNIRGMVGFDDGPHSHHRLGNRHVALEAN